MLSYILIFTPYIADEIKSAVEYQAVLVNNVCAFPCPSSIRPFIHSSDSLLHVPHINNCHYLLPGITEFFCVSVAVSVMLSCKKNLFKEVRTSYHKKSG